MAARPCRWAQSWRPPPRCPQPAPPRPSHAPSRQPSAGIGPATTGFEQKPHFRVHTGSPCLRCCRLPRDVALTRQTTRRHGLTPECKLPDGDGFCLQASPWDLQGRTVPPQGRRPPRGRHPPRGRRPPQGQTPSAGGDALPGADALRRGETPSPGADALRRGRRPPGGDALCRGRRPPRGQTPSPGGDAQRGCQAADG